MPLMNRIKSFLASPQGRRAIDQGVRAASRRGGRSRGGAMPHGTGTPAGGGMPGHRGGGLLSRLLRR